MPRVPDPIDIEKSLMVKVKTCQRLEKESSYYKQEVIENENKLTQMRKDNRDPYDIKKFEEVLGESVMMVPDSQARWQKSLEDLSMFFGANETDLNPESDWIKVAKTILVKNGFMKEDEITDDVALTNIDQLEEGEEF